MGAERGAVARPDAPVRIDMDQTDSVSAGAEVAGTEEGERTRYLTGPWESEGVHAPQRTDRGFHRGALFVTGIRRFPDVNLSPDARNRYGA